MAAQVSERNYRKWLDRKDLTIEELVETAEAMLPEIAPEQTRYKVRDRPDVRTIRYYIAENLLPKAFGYEGGRARYGGTHLLRLLLIKRMQAEHETLGRIAQKLKNATDDQVVAALKELTRPAKKKAEAAAEETHRLHLVEWTAEPEIDEAEEPEQASKKRLNLSSGGSVEVPEQILTDPVQRRRLADDLSNLAEWLRASLPPDD